MSVATEFVPVVTIPEHARLRNEPRRQLASVVELHAPALVDSPPLRLTRRGIAVLSLAVAAVSAALVGLAVTSAPTAPAPSSQHGQPHAVLVEAGDSLWSIASRVAPDRDPRAEVEALQRANHISGVTVVPGQVLRVP